MNIKLTDFDQQTLRDMLQAVQERSDKLKTHIHDCMKFEDLKRIFANDIKRHKETIERLELAEIQIATALVAVTDREKSFLN